MTPPVFVVDAADLAAAGPGGTVLLGGAEGRHAVSVRRMVAGERLDLVDGAGRRAHGRVAAVLDRTSLDVEVDTVIDEPAPQPRMVVVQALPKGDRGELAVELLTEVGVDVIVPWSAANCVTQWKGERASRSHRRWSDAALAAGKQARRARFPEVTSVATTAEVVDLLGAAALSLVLDEEATDAVGDVSLPLAGDVVVIVGPEGGLTTAERDALAGAGARTVRLGPSVMRTSSAGMAAAAALLARSPRWTGAPRLPGVEG